MRTSRIGGILASALLVVGAAACGGNEDAGAVGEPEASDATAPETDEDVAAPEATTEDAEPQGPGGYPVREDDEAAAASGRPGPRKPVKVTYQASGTGPDEAMTLVYDGARFAMHFGGGRIIQTEDAMIFCGADGEGCFEAPGNDRLLEGMAGAMGGLMTIEDRLEDEAIPDSWRVVDGRTVAGRETTCAEFDAADVTPGESGTMTYCYDEELGIGLYWDGLVDGDAVSFEATAVETPTDADFEPTGPVTSSGQ